MKGVKNVYSDHGNERVSWDHTVQIKLTNKNTLTRFAWLSTFFDWLFEPCKVNYGLFLGNLLRQFINSCEMNVDQSVFNGCS